MFRGQPGGAGVPAAGGGVGVDGGGEGEQPGYFSEFLSARICRHPIFTDMRFWQHVLSEAVQAKTEKVRNMCRHTSWKRFFFPSWNVPFLASWNVLVHPRGMLLCLLHGTFWYIPVERSVVSPWICCIPWNVPVLASWNVPVHPRGTFCLNVRWWY